MFFFMSFALCLESPSLLRVHSLFFFSLGELIFKMNPTYYIQQNIVSRILIFPPNNLIRTVESLFSKLASLQMSQ